MKELFVILTACFGAFLAAVQDEPTVLKPAPDEISEGPRCRTSNGGRTLFDSAHF